MEKQKVLFLCTHNSARSQMSEALLRFYAGDRFEAFSAGLHPSRINPFTTAVLQEIGIDTAPLYAKDVKLFLGKTGISYVITVCSHAEQECPIFPGVTAHLHWPFDDPSEFTGTDAAKLAKFRTVRDEIYQHIQKWVKELG